MQKYFAFCSNYSTSVEFIIRQTFRCRTPRPGNVELHHLGEFARRNSRDDFTESLLSRWKTPSKYDLNRKPNGLRLALWVADFGRAELRLEMWKKRVLLSRAIVRPCTKRRTVCGEAISTTVFETLTALLRGARVNHSLKVT